MSSLLANLPNPRHLAAGEVVPVPEKPTAVSISGQFEPPPYGRRGRDNFVPRKAADFGTGGAFPEIQ